MNNQLHFYSLRGAYENLMTTLKTDDLANAVVLADNSSQRLLGYVSKTFATETNENKKLVFNSNEVFEEAIKLNEEHYEKERHNIILNTRNVNLSLKTLYNDLEQRYFIYFPTGYDEESYKIKAYKTITAEQKDFLTMTRFHSWSKLNYLINKTNKSNKTLSSTEKNIVDEALEHVHEALRFYYSYNQRATGLIYEREEEAA